MHNAASVVTAHKNAILSKLVQRTAQSYFLSIADIGDGARATVALVPQKVIYTTCDVSISKAVFGISEVNHHAHVMIMKHFLAEIIETFTSSKPT